jgi:uncharacterized protein (DUF849 family)
LRPAVPEQVAKIVRILGEMGLEAATPTGREMLNLKGGDRVAF